MKKLKSIAGMAYNKFFYTTHPLKGNNDRLNGWRVVREYLKPILKEGKKTAKLQVFSICENFIRTFPSLVYDPIKVEDCDTDGEDHAADSLRYGLMTRPTIKEQKGYKQKPYVPTSEFEGK